MNTMKKLASIAILIAICSIGLFAQQSVDPSGNCNPNNQPNIILGQTSYFACYPTALGAATGTWTAVSPGVNTVSYRINFSNATLIGTAGTSAAVTVFTLPAGATVIASKLTLNTQFTSSGAMSALTVSLGNATAATTFNAALNVWVAATNTTFNLNTAPRASTQAADAVLATFTATGANLTTLTAGAVTVTVTYVLPAYGFSTVTA